MQEAIAGSAAREDAPRLGAKGVAAAVVGNVLEFFDFTSYSFFAVMIGRAFFPAESEITSLLLSLSAFGAGFVTRPLGGIVIGAYADRVGRKPAMLLTIVLMAVGMLIIAVTPSYAVIGPAAPALVVFARLVQGFALGGEVGPATTYLLEAAPADKKASYTSWQLASQGISVICSGLLGVVLSSLLSPTEMQEWGWRVPFVIGLAIIPVGLVIRRSLPDDVEAPVHPTTSAVLSELVLGHPSTLVLAILVITATTIAIYVGNYMTSYALTTLKMDATVAFMATLTIGIGRVVASLLGGYLADRVGRKPIMILSQVALVAAAYPAFLLLSSQKTLAALVIASGTLSVLTSFGGAVGLTLVPESFPASVRSTGLSIAYATAVTVFGGSAQVIVTWLIVATGNPLSPAWYLIASSLVGIGAIVLVNETGKRRVT